MESTIRVITKTENRKGEVQEVPRPKPGKGEVLIRVEAAPINPSDLMFFVGKYGVKERVKQAPSGVGCEGSGQIVEVGEGVDEGLINRKVGFMSDVHDPNYTGTWRQYVVMRAGLPHIIVFDDSVDYALIATVFANPLTAAAFLEIAKVNGYKAIIHSAAASSLGKILVKLFNENGVEIINLVRRQEQVEQLQAIGAKYVLNTTESDFQSKLKALCNELQPQAFFDAVAGDLPVQVLHAMPEKSILYNYGALAKSPFIAGTPIDFIFYQKEVKGFWLPVWLKETESAELHKYISLIEKDLNQGGKIFSSVIIKEFALDQWEEAMDTSLKRASEGKVLIRPHK